jgi:ubiquitin C-terminal hydrolase
MNYEIYKDKGLCGLANLGNTCFINSCIQVISHTYELNDFLNTEQYKTKIQNKYDSALLIEWDNLRKILWNQNCVIAPNKFLTTIQKVAKFKNIEIFAGYEQNDVSEFLLFLIECFHNSIARKIQINITGNPVTETDNLAIKCFKMMQTMYSNEYSEIWNIFYGIHVSEIICLNTGKVLQQTPEPYFMINLPIPPNNSPTLIDCFDLYVSGEVLEGENAWYYEEEKQKINIRKKILFWSLPNILVVDLKRFNSRNTKNQVLVNFSTDDLDLSKYVIGYKKTSFVYELYGVCNHSGNVLGGHYTCFVKNANNKWYHFNDTTVSEVGLHNSIITPKAYVLFYRKKQNLSPSL